MKSAVVRWIVVVALCTPSLAGATFDFSASQSIDGKTVTCSGTSSTSIYTECDDLKVDGLYFPNGITCGPVWSTTNSRYSDTQGFCQSLTGSTQFEAFYTCDDTATRATWFDHVWGTFDDNGFTQHVRCYRDASVAAPALGLQRLAALGALLLASGCIELRRRRSAE
jgi:hypothetical protein